MKSYALNTIVLAVGLSHATLAASAPLITSPGIGPSGGVSNGATVGALFEVGFRPLSVESLGLFDYGAPGLSSSHSVGLWTETGTLLARVDFSPGLDGFSNDGFIYKNLASPVILQPGLRYVLGADYPVGTLDRSYVNGSLESETWSGAVTFVNSRYTLPEVGFVFPNFNAFGLSYVGANAQFVVVPEPSTLALVVFGVGAMLPWRVRCRPTRG